MPSTLPLIAGSRKRTRGEKKGRRGKQGEAVDVAVTGRREARGREGRGREARGRGGQKKDGRGREGRGRKRLSQFQKAKR